MSKKTILSRIQQAKPAPVPLPDMPTFAVHTDPKEAFTNTAAVVGIRIIPETKDINAEIKRLFPDAQQIASPLPEVASTFDITSVTDPHELALVDVAVIKGRLGVAENGAIWVTEADCVHRVLPFITQHLVILLEPDHLVHQMHEAYAKIKIDETGFGLFVAGPSKTADIEQSLVIGAQGARSLTVIFV